MSRSKSRSKSQEPGAGARSKSRSQEPGAGARDQEQEPGARSRSQEPGAGAGGRGSSKMRGCPLQNHYFLENTFFVNFLK